MTDLLRTPLCERHLELGATMVEFGGWEMPIHYPAGIVQEHLATRARAGVFDISHMGRIRVTGEGAVAFLQHVLTNNAAALEPGEAQYTMIADPAGGAIDDAYLYRFLPEEYLLVVNASNRLRVWEHLHRERERAPSVRLEDVTAEVAMVSLQGPAAKEILSAIVGAGRVPEPMRNRLSLASFDGGRVLIGRTGYTGEPLGFEIFIESARVRALWDRMISGGGQPVGLGARDTLRLEAALPLYGHELGCDPDGREIPIFACHLARFAVSFSPLKGDFIGREALTRQFDAYRHVVRRDYHLIRDLPRMVRPVAVVEKGIARTGASVYHAGRPVGVVTSGTMVPYWQHAGSGIASVPTGEKGLRAIGLALLDSDRVTGDEVEIDIRGRMTRARIVPYHLRNEAPPYARPILWNELQPEGGAAGAAAPPSRAARGLVEKAVANTLWRQHDAVNLIPSETTPSALVRLLSIMDPAGRYAEHKTVKAFKEAEVFYYQGTDFIAEVERLLIEQMRLFLGCTEVEARLVSGQMANMAVYSAMVDYVNRANRKSEQRRLRKVMNHHIIKGGHLSAQPMGALRDFVVRDLRSEKPAVVNFPVMAENPFRVDVEAARRLMAEHRPELVILGKSMILHREPVGELRAAIDELGLDTILLYDMAHVLGLAGPHFQEPFREGADIVTGSTHKTFFGTQRGVAAVRFTREDARFELWEAIQRRTFPGSVSNHHLGTLLGLLMAAYEMNRFKNDYPPRVIANAKAFARAMKTCGLDVAGDCAVDFTETHQVIVKVGYGRGAEIARRLEENNIILNYQAAPDEEGFTAAGALRMGVQEMTRFGMGPADFGELAELMADCILRDVKVKEQARALRRRFIEMRYCFGGAEMEAMLAQLKRLI
jgi:aminomethyltransferase